MSTTFDFGTLEYRSEFAALPLAGGYGIDGHQESRPCEAGQPPFCTKRTSSDVNFDLLHARDVYSAESAKFDRVRRGATAPPTRQDHAAAAGCRCTGNRSSAQVRSPRSLLGDFRPATLAPVVGHPGDLDRHHDVGGE